MNTAIFFHAGCPVCLNAETRILDLVDTSRFKIEIVHLGEHPLRIPEAESLGVRSVPALVCDGDVLHLNHGASLAELSG